MKYDINCTNHATNITKQVDISKFSDETQQKLLQLIRDFEAQYKSFSLDTE